MASPQNNKISDDTHTEGIDHIKSTLNERGATPSTLDTSATYPPASNPGSDNPSAGIAQNAGEPQTLIGTAMSYLGLGGGEKKAEDVSALDGAGRDSVPVSGLGSTASSSGNHTSNTWTTPFTGESTSSTTGNTTGSTTGSTIGSTIGSTTGHTTGNTTSSSIGDSSSGSYTGAAQSAVASAGAAAASAVGYGAKDNQTTLPDRTKSTTGTESTSGVTGSGSSGGVPDPAHDGSVKKESTGAIADPSSDKSAEEAPKTDCRAQHLKSGANPKSLEHPDSIPTAGGEKLGKQHWGESKIIPDNPPKPQEEQSGVSSSAGQPTSEVKDNTSKNTGGASSGPHSSSATTGHNTSSDDAGKEKLTDKIKDKLHIGSK